MNDLANETVSVADPCEETIEILCVDDDPDYLDLISAHLSDNDEFNVRTETDPQRALDVLDELDCIVSDYDMPGLNGLELLSRLRDRDPNMPFVLCTGSSREQLAEKVPDEAWTEYMRKSDVETIISVLTNRIRRMVSHNRTLRTANRTLTAVEASGDGIAIVNANGRFTFVNRVFASQFGAETDDLIGRHWQTCFPDEEVERLQSTALQTIRDDWQWTGGCRCVSDGGDRFTAQTRVAGLDDGSFVLCLSDIDEK